MVWYGMVNVVLPQVNTHSTVSYSAQQLLLINNWKWKVKLSALKCGKRYSMKCAVVVHLLANVFHAYRTFAYHKPYMHAAYFRSSMTGMVVNCSKHKCLRSSGRINKINIKSSSAVIICPQAY